MQDADKEDSQEAGFAEKPVFPFFEEFCAEKRDGEEQEEALGKRRSGNGEKNREIEKHYRQSRGFVSFRNFQVLVVAPERKDGNHRESQAEGGEHKRDRLPFLPRKDAEREGFLVVDPGDSALGKEMGGKEEQIGRAGTDQDASPFPPAVSRVGDQNAEDAGEREKKFREEERDEPPEESGVENGRIGIGLPADFQAAMRNQQARRVKPGVYGKYMQGMDVCQAEENDAHDARVAGELVPGRYPACSGRSGQHPCPAGPCGPFPFACEQVRAPEGNGKSQQEQVLGKRVVLRCFQEHGRRVFRLRESTKIRKRCESTKCGRAFRRGGSGHPTRF